MNPKVSVGDLAKFALTDPAFAVSILRVVNGAAYATQTPVANVRTAAALLGTRGLRTIALGMLLSQMIPSGPGADHLLVCTLRRAAAARLVAEVSGLCPPDDAMTAGLLMDLGYFVNVATNPSAVEQVMQSPPQHREVLERALGLSEHVAAGVEAARTIGLSSAVIEAIAHHHDEVAPQSPLARAVWSAEQVAMVWEGGDATRHRADATRRLSTLHLNLEQIGAVFARVPDVVQNLAASLDRRVEDVVAIDLLVHDATLQLVELNAGYDALVKRLEDLLAEKEKLAASLTLANAELERLAMSDSLTHLPNRRAFDDACVRDFARDTRQGSTTSVLLVDVDFFKKVNDRFGHAAGDAVLQAVATTLQGSLRAGDLTARYGGEEFAVILPATERAGALIAAERLRRFVEELRVRCGDDTLAVTVSVGVATTQRGVREEPASVVRRADAALYEAKRSGRNRVVVAAPVQAGREEQERARA